MKGPPAIMSTPKNVTPKTVADSTVNKKQENPTVVEDVKIPNQTATEPETVEETAEETKTPIAKKILGLVKKNRNTIVFVASVGAFVLGVRSLKKERREEPVDAELVTDENNTDSDTTNTDEG